jgi:hypothetical protein
MPFNGYFVRYCSFYKLVMGAGVQPQVFSFFIFTMRHFDWPHHKIIYTTLDIPPNGSLHAQRGILEVSAFGPPI